MRRTLIIATMLLPLPFAAIPIVSVVVAPAQTYGPEFIAVDAAADQGQPDQTASYGTTPDDVSLTFRGEHYSECQVASTSPIEG